jgi:hypothetical protein
MPRIRTPPALVSAASALDDQHRQRGEAHAPPQGGGQRDRGEPVEHGLGGEQLVVAGQAVLDGADDGERPDAEEQAGGHEALADPRVRLARQPPLDAGAQRVQAALDRQGLAGQAAQQHAAQHVERVGVAPRERVVDPDHQRDQAEAHQHDALERARKPGTDERADGGAREHRADVYESTRHPSGGYAPPAAGPPPGRASSARARAASPRGTGAGSRVAARRRWTAAVSGSEARASSGPPSAVSRT